MKIIKSLIFSIFSIFVFAGCDDNTAAIGGSIVPDSDKITVDTLTVHARSKSISANDSILANTSNVYLGRYTDPETKATLCAGFLTQFNCVENYGFPEDGVIGDSTVSVELKLFYNNYFGDSLNTMQCEVYELDRTLQEGMPYYTNIDPTEFYDESKKPIGSKVYCAKDNTIPDSVRLEDNYTTNITVKLPNEIGKRFIEKYYEIDENGDSIGKINFSNSEEFINNVFKGIYVKSTRGDGTVMYITTARLNVSFQYHVRSSSGEKDSIATGIATFSSTREVLQVNKFDNGNLTPLIDDNSCTYIKTPAGIFTEVELPVDEITEKCDTLNSVKITFTRYNSENNGSYGYSIPGYLLMVRKSDMYDFFLKNRVYDNETSYCATFSSSSNEYTYSNIARLVNICASERDKGVAEDAAWESKNPDWNKVVLIPITMSKSNTTNSVVSVSHNHAMTSIRLQGGETPVKVSIVTSRFNNE